MTRAPDLGAADWLHAVQGLMPRGHAWPREPDAVQTAFLTAIAGRMAVQHGRILDLSERESDPSQTVELLSDWERAYGLPEVCTPNQTFTRASVASYFGPTGILRTAGINQLRYLYDPVTGVPGSPIIELAATNLQTNSTNLAPGTGNFNIGANTQDMGAVAAPDGSNTGRRLKTIVATASSFYGNYAAFAVLPSTSYAMSAFVALAGGSLTTGNALIVDQFDVGLGFLGRSSINLAGQGLSAAYTRLKRVFVTAPSCVWVQLYWVAFQDIGTSLDLWGLQFEAGTAATSFIYTGTAAATRAADVLATRSITARRGSLLAKIAAQGGQSRAYFIALAAALGFTVTIEEFRPFRAGVGVAGGPIYGADWIFTWRVHAPTSTTSAFVAGAGAAGDPLRAWGNAALECVLGQYKPARTALLFAYGS